MGGKGDDEDPTAAINAMYDTTSHPGYYINRQTGEVQDGYGKAYGNKDTMWPAAKPAEPEPAAPAEEAVPAAVAAPDPMANMPAAPATDTTLAPPATPSVPATPATPATPSTGDALGGAVLKPPKYWTGGVDQYDSAQRTGRGGAGAGAIKTTQT